MRPSMAQEVTRTMRTLLWKRGERLREAAREAELPGRLEESNSNAAGGEPTRAAVRGRGAVLEGSSAHTATATVVNCARGWRCALDDW